MARPTKTVHAAITAVMRDVGAVGKRGRNDEAGYSFRRIEDVIDALNPVMAKHGVHVAPKVLGRKSTDLRLTEAGTVALRHVELEVRFRIYGPAGDHVDVVTFGEGVDGGDKATSKAHTSALKNGLLPAFMIPTHTLQVDGDETGGTVVPPAAAPAAAAADEVRRVSVPQLTRIRLDFQRHGITTPAQQVEAVLDATGREVFAEELTYDEAGQLLVWLAVLSAAPAEEATS